MIVMSTSLFSSIGSILPSVMPMMIRKLSQFLAIALTSRNLRPHGKHATSMLNLALISAIASSFIV
jgi:hypothetical protein